MFFCVCRLRISFKINFFKNKSFWKNIRNCFDPNQGWRSVGPDLGRNCLQMFSPDDKNRRNWPISTLTGVNQSRIVPSKSLVNLTSQSLKLFVGFVLLCITMCPL